MTSLPASDPGSAAVWGSKRINPRPQFCLCLAWSGCPSNDDDDDDDDSYPTQAHENSEKHRNATLTYLTRKRGYTFTSKLEEQIKAKEQYWWHVMERITAVICTLAEQSLPFRGNNKQFGSPNNDNYLGLLELVAKFYPFFLLISIVMENQDQEIPLICQKLFVK